MSKKKTHITKIVTEIDDLGLTEYWDTAYGVASEPQEVTIQGKKRSITMSELGMRSLAKQAMGGSSHALRQFNEMARLASEKKQADINEEIARWKGYKEHLERQFADHLAAHGTEPDTLPHPDDITFDARKGVIINGPISADELRDLRQRQRIVKACLIQNALDERMLKDGDVSGALLLATWLNDLLPKRFKMSDRDMLSAAMAHQRTPKRVLLKSARAAWHDAGFEAKRGQRFGSLEKVKAVIDCTYKACALIADTSLTKEQQVQELMDYAVRTHG